MPTLIAQAKLRQATRLTVVDGTLSASLTSAITIACIGAKVKRTIIDLECVSTISLTTERLFRIGFTNTAQPGNFQRGQRYQITTLGTADYNLIADTTAVTYQVGSVFTAANSGEKIPQVTGRAMLTANLMTSTLTCKFPTYIRIDLEALGMDSYEGQDCIMQLDEGVVIQGNYPGSEFTPNPPEASFMTFRIPKYFRSQLASSVSSSTLVLRIKQLASSLQSAASLSAIAILNPGKLAALVFSLGSINAVARKTAVFASALSSVITTVIINTRARLFESSLSSQFTMPPIDFWYRRLGVSAMTSTATISAAVTRNIGPIICNLQQAVQFNATANKTAGITESLLTSSSVNAVGISTLGIPPFTITTSSSLSVSADIPMILSAPGTFTNLPVWYGSINALIEWGDGTTQTVTSTSGVRGTGITHSYATANANRKIKITGFIQHWGYQNASQFLGFAGSGSGYNATYQVESLGKIGITTLIAYGTDQTTPPSIPNTVTDISYFYYNANVGNPERLANWNTANVQKMEGVFRLSQGDLSAIPIGGWNTGSVTTMLRMFRNSGTTGSGANFNADISGWNVSNVIDMSEMFMDTGSFNRDLSSWDVGSVTNFAGMFQRTAAGTTVYNFNLASWDVSSATNMTSMFFAAGTYSHNLSGWCVPGIPTLPSAWDVVPFAQRPVWGTCPP